jgi:hypothetical protein
LRLHRFARGGIVLTLFELIRETIEIVQLDTDLRLRTSGRGSVGAVNRLCLSVEND